MVHVVKTLSWAKAKHLFGVDALKAGRIQWGGRHGGWWWQLGFFCWKKHRAVYLIRSIIWLKFWMLRTNSSSVKLYIYFCVVHLSRPCFGIGPILFVQQMNTWRSHATPITVEFDITWRGCEVLRIRRWRCMIPLHLGTSKKLFDWPMSTLWCLLWVHQSYVIVWMHSLLGINWLQ